MADKFRVPEDQTKFLLPLNRLSETIYTDQRLIIDAKVLTEPRTFRTSKINRVSSRGIVNLTFAQDVFDPATDFVEKDENGNTLYFWADYFKAGSIAPVTEESTPLKHGEITVIGNKPQIRLGGGYKKLEAHLFEGDTEIEFEPGEWKFYVDDNEISDKLQILTTIDSDNVELNQIKFKLPNDNNSNEKLLGKKIKAEFHTLTGTAAECEVSVISL